MIIEIDYLPPRLSLLARLPHRLPAESRSLANQHLPPDELVLLRDVDDELVFVLIEGVAEAAVVGLVEVAALEAVASEGLTARGVFGPHK